MSTIGWGSISRSNKLGVQKHPLLNVTFRTQNWTPTWRFVFSHYEEYCFWVGTTKICHKNDTTLVPLFSSFFLFLYLGLDPSVNSLGWKNWASPRGSFNSRVSLVLNPSVNPPLACHIVHCVEYKCSSKLWVKSSKVNVSNSIIFITWTSMFEWHVVRCGYQNDMF